jgi:hypothetical protein
MYAHRDFCFTHTVVFFLNISPVSFAVRVSDGRANQHFFFQCTRVFVCVVCFFFVSVWRFVWPLPRHVFPSETCRLYLP